MSLQKSVLIVDDNSSILEVLEARLIAANFAVQKAAGGPEALKLLRNNSIDLLISDVKMPDMSGIQLLNKARALYPCLPVILLTAYGTIPDAVNAVQKGATDYLTKPFDGKVLVKKINAILCDSGAATTNTSPAGTHFVWGKSKPMQELKNLCSRVAGSSANILILGESGVGKEGIAKHIHENSTRANKPYVVVDCGTTPAGILESELFGHLKGSFTNAIQDKKGLIEAADEGTLFLDEVGNISSDMQSRLLRFLEERTIRQVGAIKEKKINCRVIAATNADLKDEVENGTFRQDLYYRLRVVTLRIPPLCERIDDIEMLAKHFVETYTRENSLGRPLLSQKTLDWMKNYDWPGNVRELKNCLETGILLCQNNQILPEDLQLDTDPLNICKSDEVNFSIEQSEKEAIIRALKETKGVKKEAAELLGISRRAIQYKSKKYRIDSANYKR